MTGSYDSPKKRRSGSLHSARGGGKTNEGQIRSKNYPRKPGWHDNWPEGRFTFRLKYSEKKMEIPFPYRLGKTHIPCPSDSRNKGLEFSKTLQKRALGGEEKGKLKKSPVAGTG